MVYYSDTPKWIFTTIKNFTDEICSKYSNISNEILDFEDDNICFYSNLW